MLGWSAIVCLSTGVGVAMVAKDLVPVVLGAKWIDATPLVVWMALNAATAAILSGTPTLLDVKGMPATGARIQWSRFAVFTAIIFIVAWVSHSVMAVVETRLIVSALFIPSVIFAVQRSTGVPARDYWIAMWRPCVAAGAMALAIFGFDAVLPFAGAGRLALDVIVGAATYVGTVLALWQISGRPEGAEADILTLWRRTYARVLLLRPVRPLPQAADEERA
jgi:O-antigen/teichoic acid export membrane protein